MKNFKYISAGFLIILCLISCKKSFLEVTDNSNLNRQSYVKNLKTMEEFQRGIYMNLSGSYGGRYSVVIYPELMADNLKPPIPTRPLTLHYNWSQVAGNANDFTINMNQAWTDLYGIIRSCNFVIEDVDKYADENQEKVEDIKGQAYAIRALMHLTLVNIFAQTYVFTASGSHAGIPYIATSDISEPYSRLTVAEVYNRMISDLDNAISLMPASVKDIRLINSIAAKALLTRIYLYKGDYFNAKKFGLEIINQVPLMSIGSGYPLDLFKNKQPAQTEILFQLIPVDNNYIYTGPLGTIFDIDYFRITNDLVNVLTENSNDFRSKWVTNVSGSWRIKKFPLNSAGIHSDPAADYYVPILRSSEIFLTVAEACAMTNDEINARVYLNAIRKRADPTAPDITASGQDLLDLIYKERRKELCFEGFRMWDLQRLKLGVHRTDVLSGYQTTLPYPSDKAISPIPMPDVKLIGLAQNPSY